MAVSVNPVDFKVRMRDDPGGKPKVLGYDAAGTVEAVGREVMLFKPGDAVFYAGDVTRPGTDSEFHVVDERIAGRKPKTLGFAEAAALPLTAITAWELFFDRVGMKQRPETDKRTLLIVGGAGGVGSIAIQLARVLTGLTVVATASRSETKDWVRRLGADHVVDHTKPLADQLTAIGFPAVDIVASLAGSRGHAGALIDLLAPQGRFGLIEGDGLSDLTVADIAKLSPKCASLHFEFMFARSRYETADMIRQHELLNAVADLVDQGKVKTTLTRRFSPINAANLREATAAVESGKTIGKIVLEGWSA